MRNAATTMTDRYKKARLPGLFVWLAVAAAVPTTSLATQTLVLEVEKAEVTSDPRTREPIVAFKLTPVSARAFAEYTTRYVGRAVEFRIDGRVVMKPVIRTPIIGGSGQIVSNLTFDQAATMAARLSSGATKIELDVGWD